MTDESAIATDVVPLTACDSCGEDPQDTCLASPRNCGHHCNHVWVHDECCWCRATFGEAERQAQSLTEKPNERAARPTGMCGSASKCQRCPSDFLCYTKASAERDLIRARERDNMPVTPVVES